MSAPREVRGLLWAKQIAESPHQAVKSSGARLRGLRYERAVAHALGSGWRHGLWFQFEDCHGLGHCQPDWLRVEPHRVIVLECKLTDTPRAREQLLHLYVPVLWMVYRRLVKGIVVAQGLTPQSTLVVSSLDEALGAPGMPVWHLPKPAAVRPTYHEAKPTSAPVLGGDASSWIMRK